MALIYAYIIPRVLSVCNNIFVHFYRSIIRHCGLQKKFQQRHLATVAAVKDANSTSSDTKTMSSTVVNNVVDGVQPVPPARRFGVSPQQSQRRSGGPGPGDKDSVLQVDVKGKVCIYRLFDFFFFFVLFLQ